MKFIIQGGAPLHGEVTLAGAKNAASKLLVSTLLTEDECVLENFPRIGETDITAELCRIIGSELSIDGNVARIRTATIKNTSALSLARKNRIPILTLGPLLNRAGEAEVPILGGDKIGPRPVDIHIDALRKMGAEIEENERGYRARVNGRLRGTLLLLRYPSVMATESTILAAVLADGKTTIRNAATEPEIIDLIKMLQKMGALIELGANRTIFIDGVQKLHGTHHRVIPDRNEAVSFACLAVTTNGKIKVKEAIQEHLLTFLNALRRAGGEYEVAHDGIIFWRARPLTATAIETDTHPGFMTDWQQPFAVLFTQASGDSHIHETVHEDRFVYAKDLIALGANIEVSTECLGELDCRFKGNGFAHSAIIRGQTPLRGANLQVRDLRSGIAHVIAALTASGESVIDGVEEIYRGYERIDERLLSLGAKITRAD